MKYIVEQIKTGSDGAAHWMMVKLSYHRTWFGARLKAAWLDSEKPERGVTNEVNIHPYKGKALPE